MNITTREQGYVPLLATMKRPLISPDLVVILSGVTAALHVCKLAPALPALQAALHVSLLQAGFLLSMVQLAGMTLGLAVGLTADGLGLRRSMLAGLSILALASALGGWAQSASDLLWLRAAEGFGFLLVALPGPNLIRQLVPTERLSLKLGLWGTYMPLGTAMALLAGPWAVDALGWGGWWWTLALLSAIMALWMALCVPTDGRRRPVLPKSQDRSAQMTWWHRLRQTLLAGGPWLVALSFAAYSGPWLAVIGFLPSIYAQAGIGGALAGALTALAAACNVPGNIVAGRLLQRGSRPEHLLYIGFGAMALGAFLAFGLPGHELPLLRYAGVLLFSGVGGLVPATLFVQAVRVAPGEQTVSTTVGWMQQCSSFSQFAYPPLAAWVAGSVGGWQWTWAVTGAAALLGAALAGRIAKAG
ncbi:MFS transporter [Pseudomonas canadensis]|uniref:MFS transporter n=1 Tax=Pseudomonas canadensis TaxID=915099 RepID=A0ABZ1ADL8_9PSED|nr:MFS transporter [Pseudomonas canadensis]WRI27487.1 MFS transporter [Pseudomonas canadensis]